MNDPWYVLAVIAGLTAVSALNRSFFFLFSREVPMPDALKRGLRHAPIAALMAVVAPEIVLTDGQVIDSLRDARIYGALAAALYALLRRDMLGTIASGMAVFLGLKLGLGW